MGILEYQAGIKLEMMAHDLREASGANQFYSLLNALLAVAGSEELEKLEELFPGTVEERRARYNAPAGLIRPGERTIVGDYLCVMGDDGKITYTEVDNDEDESEE